MKTFFSSLKPAVIAIACLTLLLGIIYPLIVYGMGLLFFNHAARGSLVVDQQGKIIGAEWIGQNFTTPKYFHPRPSDAGDSGYDASQSSGSNLGPTSKKLADALEKRARIYRQENNLSDDTRIPIDSVTSSGSGLDPHIGIANALLQAPRIAAKRNISLQAVNHLIEELREEPTWGLFGETRVNVLRLNLALDQIPPP